MKRFALYALLSLFVGISALSTSSCSRKTGCPATESLRAKTNRKGDLSTKRGKSGLFPKKVKRGRGRK